MRTIERTLGSGLCVRTSDRLLLITGNGKELVFIEPELSTFEDTQLAPLAGFGATQSIESNGHHNELECRSVGESRCCKGNAFSHMSPII